MCSLYGPYVITHGRKQTTPLLKNVEVAVFFAEYNFSVEYKPGRLNVVVDALSRRPDFESAAQSNSWVDTTVATLVTSVSWSTLLDDFKKAYAEDKAILRLMDHLVTPSRKPPKDFRALYRSSADRYTTCNGLLYYTAVSGDNTGFVVPTHNDLCLRILYECHDAPSSGHRGHEKTYVTVSRDFYWPRQYHIVRKYIRAFEVCQRVKPSPSSRAQLQPLPIRKSDGSPFQWTSSSGFPKTHRRIMVFLFVDRFSKMVHPAAVLESIIHRAVTVS